MIVSVVSAYWLSPGPSISATSSRSSSAPGPASGAKKRAMRSNSPRRGGFVGVVMPQALGPQRAGKAVEHAVHQPRFLAAEEGVRDIDIFADDHFGRHVGTGQ